MLDRDSAIESRRLGYHRSPIDDQLPVALLDYQAALGELASRLERMMATTEPVRAQCLEDLQRTDLIIDETRG